MASRRCVGASYAATLARLVAPAPSTAPVPAASPSPMPAPSPTPVPVPAGIAGAGAGDPLNMAPPATVTGQPTPSEQVPVWWQRGDGRPAPPGSRAPASSLSGCAACVRHRTRLSRPCGPCWRGPVMRSPSRHVAMMVNRNPARAAGSIAIAAAGLCDRPISTSSPRRPSSLAAAGRRARPRRARRREWRVPPERGTGSCSPW